jgi:nicotinamidase-related amidase
MARALMLIDVQRNMLEPPAPVPSAAAIRDALQDLLLRARQAGALVIHVQNDGSPGDPDEPGTDGWQLVFPAGPGDLIVRKDQPDTFAANPALAGELAAQEITGVIIAGMQSNYCVAESSRGALKQGLQAILASGAHATYDEGEPASVISAHIERELALEGVTVLPCDDISFRETS